jgi:hypothetical protein
MVAFRPYNHSWVVSFYLQLVNRNRRIGTCNRSLTHIFIPKIIPKNLGTFLTALEWKMLGLILNGHWEYVFTGIWYILWQFGKVCCPLVYFSRFGMFYQEKSGNPTHKLQSFAWGYDTTDWTILIYVPTYIQVRPCFKFLDYGSSGFTFLNVKVIDFSPKRNREFQLPYFNFLTRRYMLTIFCSTSTYASRTAWDCFENFLNVLLYLHR